jgi:hypothetical protein
MAASRVTHRGVYHSDILAADFRRRVDDHFFTQAPLGWAAATTELPLPSTLRPRHAECVDASGRRHSVVIATTACDIWTRVSATIDILDDTGALDAATVTGLIGEAVTL